MVPWTHAPQELRENRPDAVILSGGPASVVAPGAPDLDFSLLEGLPVLGICYGHQLMATRMGGTIHRAETREYGRTDLATATGFVAGMSGSQVWMSHGDEVTTPPPGFELIGSTAACPVAAMANPALRRYGVQFHPEVSHTTMGKEVLRRFLFDIAGLRGDWTARSFVEESIEQIRAQVGDKRVFCAVSGGVDSSVVAALLAAALGEQVTCVFVDHGLLRKDEAAQVHREFTGHFHPKLIALDERERFFSALAGVTDPERKRKIIGELFTVVFNEHSEDVADCDFWAQGTIYPDVIESGSSTAAKIKSHHNVGGMPDWFRERFTIIEPIRLLFKDEVRNVGRELGLPEEMVSRQPFPGPGLAVRIVGEVTPERVHIVQEADAIFREEIASAGLQHDIWQSYAAFLDVRSVGVMGDERTYEHPIVLRAVQSEDAMTASAYPFEFGFLERVANRIVGEVKGVNRVFYDLTSKPPATIELE